MDSKSRKQKIYGIHQEKSISTLKLKLNLTLQIMAEEEIITLDSDDEDSAPSFQQNTGNVTIKRIPAAPRVIPRRPQMPQQTLPLPPGLNQPRKTQQVPRKPGVFPPFALFSQGKTLF